MLDVEVTTEVQHHLATALDAIASASYLEAHLDPTVARAVRAAQHTGPSPKPANEQRGRTVSEMSERERDIRKVYAPTPNAWGQDLSFLLRLLDAERAKVARVREVLADRRLWIFPEDRDKSIEIGVIRHIVGDQEPADA